MPTSAIGIAVRPVELGRTVATVSGLGDTVI